MKSIRSKITFITVVAILVSVLSAFIASTFTIQAQNDRDSVRMMDLIRDNTEWAVEQYLESIQQSVETAANLAYDSLDSVVLVENGVVGTYAKQSERTIEQQDAVDIYMSEYCARLQEAFASIASHTHGVITYYYCINPEVTVNEHGFFYSRVGKTGFVEQEPLDARTLDPEDIEHTTWYYTPIKRGRPSWVGPYTAHFLNELITCSYLVPVYKAGTLIGVLGMDISFETMTDQIKDIKVYDSGFACLFDEDGRVLYHPELPYGSTEADADRSVSREIFRQGDSSDELIRYTAGGEKRQMSFTTLSNGMTLVVTAPEAEITASWADLVRAILISTALIIAIFSVILMLAMGLITRPLKNLTAASRKLADGDYDVELDYTGPDEVGTLTNAFIQMRDNIKLYIDDLNKRVNTEALTGLPNMRYFFRLAEDERIRLRDEGKHSALLYFNLIGLKYFNRQYGFSEGDKLICAFAEILVRHFGDQKVSHFGRDNFAVITEDRDLQETLQAIFKEAAQANNGKTLPVRVGIFKDSFEDVRVNAACDRAKYACDRLQGSYVSDYCVFNDGMLQEVYNTRYIIDHFDQALDERWIRTYYQPIVSSSDGKICDEEALSRWVDPEMGMLSPGKFVPVLENARIIHRLDLYVLDNVLAKLKKQIDSGKEPVPQSINLSRADFDSCDIVSEICSRTDNACIPHSLLTIEVTESTVGRDFDFIKKQIQRFQELGFSVWMDDFGSGYSSLDVLQDIHFDLLKFDMRFIQRFDEGEESRIILTELIRMANGLGIDTLAEGVETAQQAEFLRNAGCTKQQGFYYSKPVPPEEMR